MIGEGIKNSPPLAPKPRNWRQSAGLQESEEAITEKIDLTEFEETKDQEDQFGSEQQAASERRPSLSEEYDKTKRFINNSTDAKVLFEEKTTVRKCPQKKHLSPLKAFPDINQMRKQRKYHKLLFKNINALEPNLLGERIGEEKGE